MILTDIEGTTSSISFVKDVLFPYARRALPGFVGINTALNAPADSGTKTSLRTECITENKIEHSGHFIQIQKHDDKCHNNIAKRHKWHHYLGEVGNTFDTTENDKRQHN